MINSKDEKETLKAQLKEALGDLIKDAASDKNIADLQRIYDFVFGEENGGGNLPDDVLQDVLKIVDAYRNGHVVFDQLLTAEIIKELNNPPNIYKISKDGEEIYPRTHAAAVLGFSDAVSKILVDQGSGVVSSVNGKIGNVTLNAGDVHALPDTTQIPEIPDVATTAEDGLMSAQDKKKLDQLENIPGLATPTQNGLMSADDKAKLDTLANVSVPGVATTTTDGLMSAQDKRKLDELPNLSFEVVGQVDDGT
ncbi:hypothetical protein [Enterococcus sp. DIV0240a]|uniref:hypothetical protein n=1 Tax=Enterococcus sp. DIV0240a TaxID=2774651 RepID=UPI003D285DDA